MATELAVRQTVARISRTVAIRAWVRTSSVIGSKLDAISILAPAHDETTKSVEHHAPAGRDDGGCASFLDQDRSADGGVGWQQIAIQHVDPPCDAAELSDAAATVGGSERAGAGLGSRQLRLVGQAPGGEAVADDLDAAAGRLTIACRIDVGEPALDLFDAGDSQVVGDGELEGLPD